jgi:hypothetical protein
VHGSTQVLSRGGDDEPHLSVSSTQTRYKRTPLGVVLHLMALSIHFGWFALLGVTTFLLYEHIDDNDNYVVALKWFCAVWNLGFAWSMALYWPHSIHSLFLRQCLLSEASHIAVYHEISSSKDTVSDQELNYFTIMALDGFAWCASQLKKIMVVLFATPNARLDPNQCIHEYCLVQNNPDGTQYFIFLFRRYNFDVETQSFVPGWYNLGNTFTELAPKGATVIDELEFAYLQAVGEETADEERTIPQGISPTGLSTPAGLSKQDVMQRRQAAGANVFQMKKPVLLKGFVAEISKPFYLSKSTFCRFG